jgi:DNA-binding beta-propeller fold protein YncE
MWNYAIFFLVFTAALSAEQPSAPLQFEHLYTFGSKTGINPPKLVNRKLARAVVGNGDFPYGVGHPSAVTTDLKHNVWIADPVTASVHVFGPNKGAYRQIRKAGDAPLQQPYGLATDAAGRIYLTDWASGGIFVFDENGAYDRALFKKGEHPLQNPTAIALSEDGRTIYVLDPPRNAVVALDREGAINQTITLPEQKSEPCAISVINNQLYVLGSRLHRVHILSPAGHPRGELQWEGVSIPTAFTYDPVQRQFLVGNPRLMAVQAFNEEGVNLASFGQFGDKLDQMERIDFLYVDPQGLVYVVDSPQGKVIVFGPSQQR